MISLEQFFPEKHMEEVVTWWKAHGWPATPEHHLSKSGLVASIDGEPAVAAWLYRSDSPICWVEWFVANPKIRRKPRAEAMSALIEGMKIWAERLGFKTVMVSARNQGLLNRLQKHGFIETDKGMSNLFFNLKGGG